MISMGWVVTHVIAAESLSFKDGHLNGLQQLKSTSSCNCDFADIGSHEKEITRRYLTIQDSINCPRWTMDSHMAEYKGVIAPQEASRSQQTHKQTKTTHLTNSLVRLQLTLVHGKQYVFCWEQPRKMAHRRRSHQIMLKNTQLSWACNERSLFLHNSHSKQPLTFKLLCVWKKTLWLEREWGHLWANPSYFWALHSPKDRSECKDYF